MTRIPVATMTHPSMRVSRLLITGLLLFFVILSTCAPRFFTFCDETGLLSHPCKERAKSLMTKLFDDWRHRINNRAVEDCHTNCHLLRRQPPMLNRNRWLLRIGCKCGSYLSVDIEHRIQDMSWFRRF